MVERGASLSMVTNYGQNSLHIASYENHFDILKWIVECNTVDINSATYDGITPIMKALKRRDGLDIAKYLVEKGANIFMKDNEGTRAIDYVTWNGQTLGPEVLAHAKDLIWESVKPFLLVAKSASNPNASTPSSVKEVLV